MVLPDSRTKRASARVLCFSSLEHTCCLHFHSCQSGFLAAIAALVSGFYSSASLWSVEYLEWRAPQIAMNWCFPHRCWGIRRVCWSWSSRYLCVSPPVRSTLDVFRAAVGPTTMAQSICQAVASQVFSASKMSVWANKTSPALQRMPLHRQGPCKSCHSPGIFSLLCLETSLRL